MAKKVSTHYKEIVGEHRQRIERLSQRRGVDSLRKLYDEAQADVARKIRKSVDLKDKFTGQQLNAISRQLKLGQATVMQKLSGEMEDISLEAQTDSLRSLVSEVAKLEQKHTGKIIDLPIDEAARFRGIITGRRESLVRAHQDSFANYGADVTMKMEDELSASLLEGESTGEAVERIAEVADTEWYQAERIVRTETMAAFNATRYDGLREAATELDDLYMRWVEYVDDETLEGLDDRVSDDSIAMHGQVAKPGALFYFPTRMPDGSAIGDEFESMMQASWAYPPNRPNDRASLSPWRPGWGIWAWEWRGRRIEL